MKRFVCVAALLLCSGVTFAAPADDAASTTGLWKIDGDVQGRPVNMMCSLTESDHKLSGNCSGAIDGYAAHQITGKVKGPKAEFYFQATFGGNPITLVVSGTVAEDHTSMNGELDVEPMAVSGSFVGKREPVPGGSATDAAQVPAAVSNAVAAASPSSTPTPAAGDPAGKALATGTWKIDGDVQGTPVKMTCVLADAEHKLTGTCTAEEDTDRKITGTSSDTGLIWHFNTEYQGQPIAVTMNATLTADATRMNGTIAVSPMDADGTFVGHKQ
jgi:hypothetical protein